jgi:hypothetical protein
MGGALGRRRVVERTYLPADACRLAKKPQPSKLFWLTYRHPDGRAVGVVVIGSHGLLHARLRLRLQAPIVNSSSFPGTSLTRTAPS